MPLPSFNPRGAAPSPSPAPGTSLWAAPQPPMPPQGYPQPQAPQGYQPPQAPQGYPPPQGYQPSSQGYPQPPQGYPLTQPQPQQQREMSRDQAASIFKQVSEAKQVGSGVFFQPGQFVVMIDALKLFTSWDGIPTFVAELLVRASNNPAHAIGSSASFVRKIQNDPKIREMMLGDIQAFFAAIFPGQVVGYEGMLEACSPNNPAHGVVLHLETFVKPNKYKQGSFTVHKFRPLTEQETAELEASAVPF